jgi:hypothetical protein
MARITINGITIDPTKQRPALAAANLLSPDASKSNFILVQAKGPLTAAQRQQLSDLGVEIHEYVPEDTYICRYLPADLSKIRSLPFVEWVNVYLHLFKISPRLRPTAAANALTPTPAAASLSKDRVTVEIVLHKDGITDALRNRIAAAAGVDPSQIHAGRRKIRLTVEQRRLDAIAAIDEVHHIEKYYPPRLTNNIARGIMHVDEAQAGGPMQGQGQIICVADTGFDQGATDDVHPAFEGRVLRLYALGRDNASDPDGHGTHVCGSVLGDLTAVDGTINRGTAPAARLVMQSVLDPDGGLGGLPDDLEDLFLPPYRDDGARVHTNSWGGPAAGAYTENSGEVDDFVANHRDCVICFAAGNDGKEASGTGVVAPGSVGSPATAKNCITVGASENNRPDFTIPPLTTPIEYGEGWAAGFSYATDQHRSGRRQSRRDGGVQQPRPSCEQSRPSRPRGPRYRDPLDKVSRRHW